jgi:hypothetical protein
MAYTSPPTLPLELWDCIESHLSNADIKSLRLACKQFNNTVFLRLNRVFLSANPVNIEVFRNIASHDKFRHQVNEIIWDEARLYRGPARIAKLMRDMNCSRTRMNPIITENGLRDTTLNTESVTSYTSGVRSRG